MAKECFPAKFTCDVCGHTDTAHPEHEKPNDRWTVLSLAYKDRKENFQVFGENYLVCPTCVGTGNFTWTGQQSQRKNTFQKIWEFMTEKKSAELQKEA